MTPKKTAIFSRNIEQQRIPLAGNFFWKLVSFVFHPAFVPVYVVSILAFLHPTMFSGFDRLERARTVAITVINLVAFPLLTVLLLKGLGFVRSVYLRSQRDRIIMYMAFGIFSFWAYTVFKGQGHYPPALSSFALGVFLAASGGLIANIYNMVSMHAIGMGGWLGFFLVLAYTGNLDIPWLLAAVCMVTGLVCTARLRLGVHSNFEVYEGLALGFFAQAVAWAVVS